MIYTVLSYLRAHTHIAMRPPIVLLYEEALNDLINPETLCAMHLMGAVSLGKLVKERKYSGTVREIALLWYSIPMYCTVVLLVVGVVVILWNIIQSIFSLSPFIFWLGIIVVGIIGSPILFSYFTDVGGFRPTDTEVRSISSAYHDPDIEKHAITLMTIEYSQVRREIDNETTDILLIETLGVLSTLILTVVGVFLNAWEMLFLSVPLSCCIIAFILYTEVDIRIWKKYAIWAEERLRAYLGKDYGVLLAIQNQKNKGLPVDIIDGLTKGSVLLLMIIGVCQSFICILWETPIDYAAFPVLVYCILCLLVPTIMIAKMKNIILSELPKFEREYVKTAI